MTDDEIIKSCECDICPDLRGGMCLNFAEPDSDLCVDCNMGNHPEDFGDDE
jgi:hypothetical protein